MKKILCLLLAAVLCVTMAACASEENKAFEAANALLEAGDYDGAIEAFSAIGRYQEIADKIALAETLKEEQSAGFLHGTWKDLTHDLALCFDGKGVGTIEEGEVLPFTYSYADSLVTVESPILLHFDVVETEGVTHLICREDDYDLVSEADYEVVGPKEVTITMDNWSEYFELREANHMQFSPFGEVTYCEPGYGIFLKEEYLSRVVGMNSQDARPDFEVTYDEGCFRVSGFDPGQYDYAKLAEYHIEPTTAPSWFQLSNDLTTTATITDRRDFYEENELDPYFRSVSAKFYFTTSAVAPSSNDTAVLISQPQNVRVTQVQGSLMLLPG